MTFDPFQNNNPYNALQTGAFNPTGMFNAGFNPMQQLNPLALLQQALTGQQQQWGPQAFGVPGAGMQHHLQQNPLTNLLQNQLLNHLATQAAILQSQLQQAQAYPQTGLQQQYGQPSIFGQGLFGQSGLGQQIPGQGQQGFPGQIGQYGQYGQPGSQYGVPSLYGQGSLGQTGLAPQSWVGQPGITGQQTLGQIHPLLLSQLAARAILPWGIQG